MSHIHLSQMLFAFFDPPPEIAAAVIAVIFLVFVYSLFKD